MKRLNFNIKDRKLLFGILTIVLVSIFTLSIAYAALNTVLNISGNAEVSAAGWDVHFENVIHLGDVNSPTITSPTTITFNPILNMPGDKYFFTVDVVNDGGIDAMIESIEKKPELTTEQAKYLKYEISYANGESINTKQLVEAGSFVRIKVTVEYRSDVVASDLPTSQDKLDLSIKLNYSQSDDSGTNVNNFGTGSFEFVNVEDDVIGSELCLGEECFYVLTGVESEDGTYTDVYLMSKYNLYVGNEVTVFDPQMYVKDEKSVFSKLKNPVVKQDSRAVGASATLLSDDTYEYNTPFYGTIAFSDSMYWSSNISGDELLLSNSNNVLQYLIDYRIYLSDLGYEVNSIMIPTIEMLQAFNCTTESCDYPFVTSTSYWVSSVYSSTFVLAIAKDEGIAFSEHNCQTKFGIRPVILYRVYNS